MRKALLVTAAALTLPLLAPVASAPGSPPATQPGSGPAPAAACDPLTPAEYAGRIPTGEDVLGFALGEQEVTVEESDTYLQAVDDASRRVSTGVLAVSQEGRPLRYAVVGRPADVRKAQRAAARLRDPDTSPARARRIAATAPAIAWVAGNVHGNEESGTDAALKVLYDLADRTDCAARQIRDNTVTVILPTQNPDGREADTRRNHYGFDLNRDWFARTQPETDGKLEALRQYPPVLFIDDHEMGRGGFFFPPNADPVYHDVADRSIGWINDLYGAAMADVFTTLGLPFFNYSVYDLFYMGYGDTVPTTAFLGAGMTFEKTGSDPIAQRTFEQSTAVWTSLFALSGDKESVLRGWAASHRQALKQGRRGFLEPNQVWAPGNTVQREVPDEKVRHYFIEPPGPGKADQVAEVVRRLQRMDVEVYRLTAPLIVPDYRPYAETARQRTLPVGTYWIPMAQAQKHWVQAMLNEDTYVPFPYFYDVTAWSGPLLANVAGGRSGAVLEPAAEPAPEVAAPQAPGLPPGGASIGLWQLDDGTGATESSGWMRWLFDHKWQIPFREVRSDGIVAGALAPIDVLVVPNGDAETAYEELGSQGQRELRQWLADGGRFVGLRGGTELAALLQLTTGRLSSPTSAIPGSLIHADVAPGPLAEGVGTDVWNFYEYDNVLWTNFRRAVAVSYPAADSEDFFVSGFAEGEEELGGTAAVLDEPYADGRVVVFAGEPNFRAFTGGTQQILWNAMFGPDPSWMHAARTAGAGQQAKWATARAAAAESVRGLTDMDESLVLTVRASAAGATDQVLAEYGLSAQPEPIGSGQVRYVVPMRTADQSPVARDLSVDLRQQVGDGVVAARFPN